MQFELTDEQQMIVDTVRSFTEKELFPYEDQVEKLGNVPPDLVQQIKDRSLAAGLYAANMPAELGGGGLSVTDRILCEEQFGHTTDILIRRAFGNVYEPLLECKGEQVERWLRFRDKVSPEMQQRIVGALSDREGGQIPVEQLFGSDIPAGQPERAEGWQGWEIRQGEEMGRPSVIAARARREGGGVSEVRIGGTAVAVMEGTIETAA